MSWGETITSMKFLQGNSEEFTQNGTFKVPKYVNTIYITACGGGGGGGGSYKDNNHEYSAAGGGGAEAIVKKPFNVRPGQTITITIGKGGAGGTYSTSTANTKGSDGTPTIIGDLVTLLGGYGASVSGTVLYTKGRNGGGYGGNGTYNDTRGDTYTRSNAAGSTNSNGGDGIIGKGGAGMGFTTVISIPRSSSPQFSIDSVSGGGGGGSLGNGGAGATYDVSAEAGIYGGGGGGGFGTSTTTRNGGGGGDGYVLIEWGN